MCEGSVAETVGMKVGDVLVQINDVTAHTLTHAEAHDVILEGKCNFTIEVQRYMYTYCSFLACDFKLKICSRGKRQEEETCQLVSYSTNNIHAYFAWVSFLNCHQVESINGENGEIEIYPPEAPVSEPEAGIWQMQPTFSLKVFSRVFLERLQKESDLNITDEEIVQIIQGEQQLAQTE